MLGLLMNLHHYRGSTQGKISQAFWHYQQAIPRKKKITDLLKKNTLFIWPEKNHWLHCKILCPLLLSWPYL